MADQFSQTPKGDRKFELTPKSITGELLLNLDGNCGRTVLLVGLNNAVVELALLRRIGIPAKHDEQRMRSRIDRERGRGGDVRLGFSDKERADVALHDFAPRVSR